MDGAVPGARGGGPGSGGGAEEEAQRGDPGGGRPGHRRPRLLREHDHQNAQHRQAE